MRSAAVGAAGREAAAAAAAAAAAWPKALRCCWQAEHQSSRDNTPFSTLRF